MKLKTALRLCRWFRSEDGMIHFVCGKPGSGKSLYTVRLILDELVLGRRSILTNVALRVGNLAQYVAENYPGRCEGGVVSRIRILTDAELQQFWRFRTVAGQEPDIEFVGKEGWKNGKRPSYAGVVDNGVMYVLDECHTAFGARQWQDTSADVLYYISQHRKLGDTVILVTQAVSQVDAQFRNVAQDFTELRHFGKEKLGLFTLPNIFRRATAPYWSAEGISNPTETGVFRLDVSGLANCYDTAAGVGIHGRSADTTQKRRGPNWVVGVLAFAAVLASIFIFLPPLLGSVFKSPNTRHITPVSASAPATPNQSQHMIISNEPILPSQSPVPEITGFAQFGGRRFYTLATGGVIEIPQTESAPVVPRPAHAGDRVYPNNQASLSGGSGIRNAAVRQGGVNH
jgi:hypothetical protein